MTRFLVLATLILLVLPVLSCSCPPAPTLQRYPDWDFTTTEGCLEYFRMAAQDEDAYHILLCLSTDVKRRKNLDLATIHTFRERIRWWKSGLSCSRCVVRCAQGGLQGVADLSEALRCLAEIWSPRRCRLRGHRIYRLGD